MLKTIGIELLVRDLRLNSKDSTIDKVGNDSEIGKAKSRSDS